MKSSVILSLVITLYLIFESGCSVKNDVSGNKLIGTWQCISSIAKNNDTTMVDSLKDQKMIKIISLSHFAFLNHDLKGGKDSTAIAFVAGGGSCHFNDSIYSEELEYCNYRDWEGLKVDFKYVISHDTLTLTGHEKKEDIKIDHVITEKYIRIGD